VMRIDEGRNDSEALADELHQAVVDSGATTFIRTFDFRLGSRVPAVRLTRGDTIEFANPIVPSAEFGPSYIRPEDENTILDSAGAPTIELRWTASMSNRPDERLLLAERSYDPDELIGRQLVLGFGHGLPIEAAAATSYQEVRTFIPSMVMQSLDLDAETADALSVIGDPITRAGERITVADDGTVRIQGQRVAGPGAPNLDTEAVESIEIARLSVGRWPTVQAELFLRDGRGQPVTGLAAGAFELREDGQPRAITLRRNDTQPTIVVLADDSLSMPREFRGEMGRTFSEGLQAELQMANPEATVLHENTDSRLWENAARAAQRNPTVVVYLTDGDVADTLTDRLRALLSSGPPVVVMKVVERDRPALEELAQLTGGVVLSATEVSAAISATSTYLQTLTLPPYVLVYEAPVSGPAVRTLEVQLKRDAGHLIATETYEPPEAVSVDRICGIYLTVTTDGVSHERVLAGRLPAPGAPVTEADLEDVNDALFGQHWIYFEAGMPSPSIWMDDLVETKRRAQPFLLAALDDDLPAMKSALQNGLRFLPSEPFAGIPSVHGESTEELLAYQDGMRIAIVGQRPRFGRDEVQQTLDILPTARATVASEAASSEDRLRQALRVSARAAVAEAALYDRSAVSELAGASLFVTRSATPFDSSVSPEARARWRWLMEQSPSALWLLPERATPFAHWRVDAQTGSLLGIIPNGTGGGDRAARIKDTVDQVQKIITGLSLTINAAGAAGAVTAVGAISLSIVAEYGKTLVRLYGIVSITIASLDASSLDEQIRRELLLLACNVVKAIILGAVDSAPKLSSQGNVLDTLDKLYGLFAEPTAAAFDKKAYKNPLSCD
ncbi:MAG: hypothetical protein AAFZ18_21720, partial [Myxococcota bacterium]